MHQIVLYTVLTATTAGLFGGQGKSCKPARLGHKKAACATVSVAQPTYSQHVAPTPQALMPAPQAVMAAPQAAFSYGSFYAAPTCTSGTCAR